MRALSERRIPYDFVDLDARSLSSGEWDSLFSHCKAEELLDTDCSFFIKKGYAYLSYDAKEELMEHPELLRLPVARSQGKVLVGFDLQRLLALGEAQ